MLRPLALVLICGLIISACANAPDDGATDARDEAQPAQDVQATESVSEDRGSGTLTLGDQSYAFTVRICDFSGESDDMVQTLVGRGEKETGDSFDVFVSRNDMNDMLTHSVSFQSGDVRSGEGTVIEAQRIRMGGNWIDATGGPGTPLIEISGDRLTATGVFEHAHDESEQMEGRIEATCRM